MKLFLIFTSDPATVNDIRGLLKPELSNQAWRADSLGGNGFCIGVVVPDKEAEEVASKLARAGVELAYTFSGSELPTE